MNDAKLGPGCGSDFALRRGTGWRAVVAAWLIGQVLGVGSAASAADASVNLVDQGQAQAVIVVDPAVMGPDVPLQEVRAMRFPQRRAEQERQALRESVKDLALYLEKMSGARIAIVHEVAAANAAAVAILIGKPAQERFGPPAETFIYEQAFRIVVSPQAIGLIGESDLAVSYAIYTVLDELGCRWFLPSVMGEYVPSLKTLALPVRDVTSHPYTYYRTIWYADADYKRRNRMGGLLLNCGHALEYYLTKKDREEHPEWVATVDGKPASRRLKWSAAGLDQFIAQIIIDRYEKSGEPMFSLSPDDGPGYDNSPEDTALDGGDYDPASMEISLTDRVVHFTNRIARIVNAKYPEVRFGVLSYAQYNRAPVKNALDPSIVPQIAPITFSRAHPYTDDGEPNNKDMRKLIEGWAKQSKVTSYYFYAWFLAEHSAPNPMIRMWSVNVPYVFKHGACRYWQPQTTPNFETSAQAIHLGNRLAWNPDQNPADIIEEFNTRLYGSMAKEMADYWNFIDECWYDVPEYAG